MHQHVCAAVNQRGGCFGFLRGVEPLVDPDHLGLDLGVDRLRAHGEAVDVADHFGNWDRADHAQRVGLGHLACDHASHVRAFVGAAVVGAHVGRLLVARGMLKLHVLGVGSHFEHGLHVAKGSAKNQLVALTDHVAKHALGIGRFGYFFYKAGDHFVAKLFFYCLASVVVRKSPTTVAHRAHVGKGDLQRLGLGRRSSSRGRFCRLWWLFFFAAAHEGSSGHGGERHDFEQRTFVQVSHLSFSLGW